MKSNPTATQKAPSKKRRPGAVVKVGKVRNAHQADYDPSQPLCNANHEAFARVIAKGHGTLAENYQLVYDKKMKPAIAAACACKLLKCDNVAKRVKWLQQQAATAAMLSIAERRQWLARVVRAKLTALDTDQDGDLLQEITESVSPQGEVTRRIKIADKRQCLMDDAKLAGELGPKEEEQNSSIAIHGGQFMVMLTPEVIEQIQLKRKEALLAIQKAHL